MAEVHRFRDVRAVRAVRAGRVEVALASAAMVLGGPALAGAQPRPEASAFAAAPDLDLPALERVVRRRSPAVEQAEIDVSAATAEVRQSRLLGNPVLDAGWATIPIGQTNPANLKSPLTQIPNYSVGLSYTFLLGKRGPRQERAVAMERGARAALDAIARAQALELARLLGVVATTTLKIEGVRALVEGGRKAEALAEGRLSASFGSPLDVDRMRIELSRTEQQLLSAQSDLNAALAACSSLVGTPCEGFDGSAAARDFLARWTSLQGDTTRRLEDRADLRAIAGYRDAATAEASLARAQAIPDPTVRLGYVRDSFTLSGAQQNSLNVSVSLPLPIFDHGQAQEQAAEAKRRSLELQRGKLMDATRARIPVLIQRVSAQRQRQEELSARILPRALEVLHDLERAAENRLVPLTDVIQARRTVSELLIEEADSYADAFGASLELLTELPPNPSTSSTARPAEEPPR